VGAGMGWPAFAIAGSRERAVRPGCAAAVDGIREPLGTAARWPHPGTAMRQTGLQPLHRPQGRQHANIQIQGQGCARFATAPEVVRDGAVADVRPGILPRGVLWHMPLVPTEAGRDVAGWTEILRYDCLAAAASQNAEDSVLAYGRARVSEPPRRCSSSRWPLDLVKEPLDFAYADRRIRFDVDLPQHAVAIVTLELATYV
jgi:hypothetical protein